MVLSIFKRAMLVAVLLIGLFSLGILPPLENQLQAAPAVNTTSHLQVAYFHSLYPDFVRKKFRRKKVAYV